MAVPPTARHFTVDEFHRMGGPGDTPAPLVLPDVHLPLRDVLR